eukprot:Lankesteria_metandrocarpae@DN5463_c0_g1_i3.p1
MMLSMRQFFVVSLLCFISYVDAFSRDDIYSVKDKSYSWVMGCPVMRVYEGEGEGLYFYQEDNDSWRNDHDTLILKDRITYEAGPTSSVTYDNIGQPHLGHKYNANDAECVMSNEYCPILDLHSNSECGSGRWTKQNRDTWRSDAYPGMKVMAEANMNEDGDRVWGCYNASGKIDDSRSKIFKHNCFNDVLVEGFKYGYSLVENKSVYVVGKRSPMLYLEGANYRVFQMETPVHGGDVIVYPVTGALYEKSVTKVSVFHTDSSDSVYPVVHASGNSFRLKLQTGGCGGTAGSHRVNILQVRVGLYQNAKGDMMQAGKHPITIYNDNYEFPTPFLSIPKVLSQIIDPPEGTFGGIRTWAVTPSQFSAYLDSYVDVAAATTATIGYVALNLSSGTSFGVFGANLMATAVTESAGSDTRSVDWSGEGYHGDVISFVDMQTVVGSDPSVAHLMSSDGANFSFAVREFCKDDGVHTTESIAVVGFGLRYDPKDAVAEYVLEDILEENCPFLYVKVGVCEGLFRARDGYTTYDSTTDANLQLESLGDGVHRCTNEGVVVADGHIATCALSDTMCTNLTVLNTACRGHYAYLLQGVWKRDDTDFHVTYNGRLNDGRMKLLCKYQTSTYAYLEPLDYVCENDYIPQGPKYGMNVINNEYVYLVGARQMHWGSSYKIFSVQSPDDGSAFTVYPITKAIDQCVTKATPYSADSSVTVPYISSVSGSTFRLQLIRSDCKPISAGERVNIMQVRQAVYTNSFGHDETIAAGMFWFSGHFTAGYHMRQSGVDHIFNRVPILFTQILDMAYPPASKYIYSIAGERTHASFKFSYGGRTGESSDTRSGLVGWIGFDFDTSRGHTLLGSLKYYTQILDGVQSGGANGRGVDYSLAFNSAPFIFADTVKHSVPGYSFLRSTSADGYEVVVESEDCTSVIDVEQTMNLFVVGTTFDIPQEADLMWAETRPGCAVMRGSQGCDAPDGDYFVQTDGSMRSADGGMRAVYEDSQWKCCTSGTYDAATVSCISLWGSGEMKLECLTSDAHCDKLELIHEDFGGVWPKANRRDFSRADSAAYIRITSEDNRYYTPTIVDAKDTDNTVIHQSNVKCLRPNLDNYPRGSSRVTISDHTSYKVAQEFYEGPGVGFSTHHDMTASADGVVFYKYFQMEVTNADREGLYTHVGGSTWGGETYAFSTMFTDGRLSFVTFNHVSPISFWVKHQGGSCVTQLGTTTLNVLLIQGGEHVSIDESVAFLAHAQAAENSLPVTFNFTDRQQVPSVFTNIQDSTATQYINSRVSSVTSSSATVYVETEVRAPLSGVQSKIAMLVVNTRHAVSGSPFLVGHIGSRRVAAGAPSAPTLAFDAVNISIDALQFGGAPFVLVHSVSANGSDPITVKLDRVTADSVQMIIKEDGCTNNAHEDEMWNMLLLGSSQRLRDGGSTPSLSAPTATPTTTTTTTTTTTAFRQCQAKNVNLEIFYVQDRSLSFCGRDTCPYTDHSADRIKKSDAIQLHFFDLMESLQTEFNSVKIGYSEFIDKPVYPHGQANMDYCVKFINSMVEMNAEYRSYMEEHWTRTWVRSGNGSDHLENQLDAMITSMKLSDFSEQDYDADGNMNLKILFMITDKHFHEKGDFKCDGGCADYVVDRSCNCEGVDYPSVNQMIGVAVEKQVNLMFNIQDPTHTTVGGSYSYLGDLLQYTDPKLIGINLAGGIEAGAMHKFDPEMIRDGVHSILDNRCMLV